MATYKLIQDVEAEDHILGPLTLKQFIYGLIAAFCFYICFICITKHVPWLLILFLPPALLMAFFAFPFKRDQPTEVWALAKVKFMFKPHVRLWAQTGITELVTITAPKKEDKHLTKNLSGTEVRGHLQALASTLDSRGWVIKNVDTSAVSFGPTADSERLIDLSSIPQPVPDYAGTPDDDVFDDNNSLSSKFKGLIDSSERAHRKHIISSLNSRATEMPSNGGSLGDESLISKELAQKQSQSAMATANMHTIGVGSSPGSYAQPSAKANSKSNDNTVSRHDDASTPRANTATPKAQTTTSDPAILNLASNDDLYISAIAHEVNRLSDNDDNEVVVQLH